MSSSQPPPQKEKLKNAKANWDAVAHRAFLEVCIEEVNKHNRPVNVLNANGKANMTTNFNNRTKRNYVWSQLKNRWDTLKKDYTVWKGLLQHASGLGRDPITHTIDADDGWWELEIQMCPEAAKFRIAPLQDEEDLKMIFDKNAVTNVTARVPPSSHDRAALAAASQANADNVEDLEGSGFEGEDETTHDNRVWTDARPRFANYPHPPHGKYYLVDSGYPNRTGYLAPFKEQRYHVPEFQGAPPQNMQEKFNHLHSSLRNAIERAFGVLKMKWRILLSIPFFPEEETQSKIITACMCLHNFIRDSKLYDDHFDTIERGSYIHEDSASYVGGNASSSSDDAMRATRQSIAQSLVA